jgi:hypothetical protein
VANTNPQSQAERPPVGFFAFLGVIAVVIILIGIYLVSSYFS